MSYSSGIYSCITTPNISNLNHAVEVIGFDSNGNYIIKNSWGTYWGNSGFGVIDSNNDCGIKLLMYQY
jgi:cathepsin L